MKKLLILLNLVFVTALSGQVRGAEDEPIVIDDLSVPELRREIEKIQNEFYRVFNNLNEDDKFDIICHRYTATGTNIPQDACEPKFMIDRRAENAKAFRDGIDDLLSPEALLADLQHEFGILTQKMNEIAADNQYFRELNQILGMLRARLAELRN